VLLAMLFGVAGDDGICQGWSWGVSASSSSSAFWVQHVCMAAELLCCSRVGFGMVTCPSNSACVDLPAVT
jgi:hypothetical protein